MASANLPGWRKHWGLSGDMVLTRSILDRIKGAMVAAITLGMAGVAAAQDETAATTALDPSQASPQQVYCQQLERQLGKDWQQGAGARDTLPRIQSQMARADQALRRGQAAAEQSDCFDYFLFSKTWRSSPQCIQLHQQINDAQRAMADLERQRQAAGSAQDHTSRQDAVLGELARNKCGPQYEVAATRRSGSQGTGFWNDGESLLPGAGIPGYDLALPGSTFRTICVRMCDGYYFPISFAATQDRFEHDAQACQSQCGSPAKLYYYPNPGGEVQQSIALDGTAYASLHNAFRYRKELVASCTCKGVPGGPDTVADTQPMQTTLDAAGAVAGDGTLDQQTGALPTADFGSTDVQPEPMVKPTKKRAKGSDGLGVTLSKH